MRGARSDMLDRELQQKSQVPPLGPQQSVAWPVRVSFRMANGLQVILAERKTFPRVRAEMLFRSGNAAGGRRFPGLAEMTATVVRAGTETRSERQIDEQLRRMGAEMSASADADTSGISVSGLAEFLPEVVELISDLSRHASFPAGEFEREKRQKVEELRVARTTPGFLSSERMRLVLFGEHPYGRIAPTEEEAQSCRRDDLQAFYREHYTPANALLVAVGDFEIARVRELLERTFDGWQAAKPAPLSAPEPPHLQGRRAYLVDMPESVQAEILVGNRAITRRHPDWRRLTLANSLFGGAFNSRLVMNIREQKGYTYSPRSTAHPFRHYGYFSVHAAVRNEVAAATLTEIFYEMDRMRALPVSAEELDDAKNYVTGAFSLGVATLEGVAGQVTNVALEDLPENYLETYRESIQSLSAGDVLEAARRYFDSPDAQIVIAGDANALREQAALFGPVVEYPAQIARR